MPSRQPYGLDRSIRSSPAAAELRPVSRTTTAPPPQQHQFRLVQRLSSRKLDNAWLGFDKYFEFSGMSSPEYSDTAISKSLSAMRASGDIEKLEVVLERGGARRPVYFVGARSTMNTKITAFKAWFSRSYLRTERPCYFDEIFTGGKVGYKVAATDAWWSLEDHLMFTLNENVADLLLKAIVL